MRKETRGRKKEYVHAVCVDAEIPRRVEHPFMRLCSALAKLYGGRFLSQQRGRSSQKTLCLLKITYCFKNPIKCERFQAHFREFWVPVSAN